MSAHESTEIVTSETQEKRSILTSITSQYQYKRGDFSKLSFERNSQTPTNMLKGDDLN